MTAWLLSIVGVVALGVLLDILLPSGEINKYIKGVFGVVVVLVIVIPLPKLVKGDFINFINDNDKIEINENYFNSVNERRNEDRESKLLKALQSGYGAERVRIEYEKNDYDAITHVVITISNSENRIIEIKKKTSELLGIENNVIDIEKG